MLKDACLLAKIDADTAENERHFAEMLPNIGKFLARATGFGERAGEGRRGRRGGRGSAAGRTW